MQKHRDFYDADFDTEAAIQYDEGKEYVYCYGRKITWMQYSTSKKTVFDNVPSRIGVDWEIPDGRIHYICLRVCVRHRKEWTSGRYGV